MPLGIQQPIEMLSANVLRCGYGGKSENKMASAFELNTLAEIAILNVAVSRIFTHLAKASADPQSFLAAELASGLDSLAKTTYWSVSHKDQDKILEIAKARYAEIIGGIR
jgi:hypothetical protein